MISLRYEHDGLCDYIDYRDSFKRCSARAFVQHNPTELQYCRKHHIFHVPFVEDDWQLIPMDSGK